MRTERIPRRTEHASWNLAWEPNQSPGGGGRDGRDDFREGSAAHVS